jgi:hypothetical protein
MPAPASMDAGTASQLIRGVRRTPRLGVDMAFDLTGWTQRANGIVCVIAIALGFAGTVACGTRGRSVAHGPSLRQQSGATPVPGGTAELPDAVDNSPGRAAMAFIVALQSGDRHEVLSTMSPEHASDLLPADEMRGLARLLPGSMSVVSVVWDGTDRATVSMAAPGRVPRTWIQTVLVGGAWKVRGFRGTAGGSE